MANNSTFDVPLSQHNPWDDAVWILTCSFIIFTMQSGFGLLESGMVSRKHEINILVKNIADVLFGGLAFWMFGFALSYGNNKETNGFVGFGNFFLDADGEDMGWVYSRYFFQASFSTTATTIVSGAMAERVKLEAYCMFSFLNTIIFCLPAHWMWSENGWLYKLGAFDQAGASTVHLVGGVTGLVATIILKPRSGKFEDEDSELFEMGAPASALLGLFMLWWGWLALNCGSTFGVTDEKWKIAARAAVTTINASIGGGITIVMLSYITKKRKLDVKYLIRGILGSLVSISALCGWAQPWEALFIGAVGALTACYGLVLLDKLHVDDPVGSISIHLFPALWAMIVTGFVLEPNANKLKGGAFKSGNFLLLGVQLLALLVVTVWCGIMACVILLIITNTIGLRVSYQEEVLGADIVEHSIGGYSKARRGGVSKANPRRSQAGIQTVESNFEGILNNLDHLRMLADMRIKSENGDDIDDEDTNDHKSIIRIEESSEDEEFEEPILPPPRVRVVYE